MSIRGRKVFDIEWSKEGVSLKIPVKAVTRKDYVTGKEIMEFEASYPEAGVSERGPDINVVKEAVIKKLDEWYTIKWELYFTIEICGGRGYPSEGCEIRYEMDFRLIGKDCRGHIRHLRVPRPENLNDVEFTRYSGQTPSDGMPKTFGKKDGKNTNCGGWPRTCSLVKATPENVAASDKFVAAMEELLEKMHTHFAPDRVEKMLSGASNLLPGPKAAKEEVKP